MKVRGAVLALGAAALVFGCKDGAADHLGRAKTAIYQKDTARAVAEYRLALDRLEKDDSAEAQVLRARALKGAADVYYLELRDVRQAIPVYRELIAQCPESPEALEAHVTLAELLRDHTHDLRGAINELSAAIARNPPQSAELSYQVAKLYFQLGDYQQASLEAQHLISRYETSPFVVDAMLLRGQSLEMMDDKHPEAARVFDELVHHFPDSELAPHALFEIGKLRAEAGQNEKAIEVWVEALKRHPDPAVVQDSIARLRRRITDTTPVRIGDQGEAFDHQKGRNYKPKSSIEAVGGTAEEAAHESGD